MDESGVLPHNRADIATGRVPFPDMLETPRTLGGMVTSPHHLASQAGLAVLRDGGTAIEAAVATAAALTVVLPHMTGLGGDCFWLIGEPGKPPLSIDGSGAAGTGVDIALMRRHGLAAMPIRGPLAANTVAGAVSSWQLALDVSAQWGGRLPLARLFADAQALAKDGVAIGRHQAAATARNLDALAEQPGFAATFLAKGRLAPAAGDLWRLPALADTLDRLAAAGLDDFYRGDVARSLAEDLKAAGSPLKADDLARHRGMRRRPLSLTLASGTVFNTAPPTQGLAALIILGIFQRFAAPHPGGAEWVHLLAEATKQALAVRDSALADPAQMRVHATTYLTEPLLDRMAAAIDPRRAAPWGHPEADGDTVWLGVIDGQGRAVSCIQSLCHAYGSGVVLPGTGIAWHNRGSAFSLVSGHPNALEPRRRPLHTLSPALARLKDGRTLVWGSMGGDAQPQTQAQLFARIVQGGADLQEAVTAPRFALRAGLDGAGPPGLKLESRFDEETFAALDNAGHRIERLGPFDALTGQAGALMRRADGVIEGAADPRSDGAVAGF